MSEDPALAALARVRATSQRAARSRRAPTPPTLSSSAPDDRDPQLLGDMLSRWVTGNAFGPALAVAGVAQRWQAIVGEQVARHVEVGEYLPSERGGELVIRADSQEWAVQVRYLTDQIARRIDEEIGPGVVTSLTVQGPGRRTAGGWRIRTGRRSPRQAPPAAPPPDTLPLD